MRNIYPFPKTLNLQDGKFRIKEHMSIYADNEAEGVKLLLQKRLQKKCTVSFNKAKGKESDVLLMYEPGETESYRIEITEHRIEITAADKKGFVHAIETLMQMISEDMTVPCVTLCDAPYKQYRGVHLYMPAPEYVEECKRLFDVLSFLKYNTIILEVGGTMELKNHPEVNSAWTAFCETIVKKFPGGPQNFQWSDRYWKDSTHFENARGKILTQETVRGLVQYAKDLGFTVIPEIQALSHCYYLTLAHREIAEDANDLFPDTYCPMNEKSYQLYFEVAQEILDVFEPEIVSIGHDEIRVMGECPKCREKSGHELLAYEINRLHAFYKERNIRIMMWCEKLLKPIEINGMTWGGGADEKVDVYGRHWKLPAMYQAIEQLPKDIIMLDWYHSRGENTEEYYKDKGFEVMFGNYSGIIFGNWNVRAERSIGAEISTWCTPDEFTLGRNGILFDLVFSAQLLWNRGYSDASYDTYLKNAMDAVEAVRNIMRGDNAVHKQEAEVKILFKAENGAHELSADRAECHGSNAKDVLEKCGNLSGVPVDKAHVMLHTDIYADSLLLCESFKKKESQYMSYTFIDTKHWDESPMSDSSYLCSTMPRWSAATHEILYEDGTWELVNAVYGITAADVNMPFKRDRLYFDDKVNEIDNTHESTGGERKAAPHFKFYDAWKPSVLYFTDTIISGENTAYVYEWKNPHPEKKIVCIKAVNTTHDREQSVILYALGYKRVIHNR